MPESFPLFLPHGCWLEMSVSDTHIFLVGAVVFTTTSLYLIESGMTLFQRENKTILTHQVRGVILQAFALSLSVGTSINRYPFETILDGKGEVE